MLQLTNLGLLATSVTSGPFLEAEIISVTGKGKLRVTYNWLYSALNCDPNDNSTFVWVFNKLDDTHISIYPRDKYQGKTLYASVRDDWDWHVQVQAPHSADWITAVGRDEILGFQIHDLSIASFVGFNNKFVSIDNVMDQHDGHNAYRLKSTGDAFGQNEKWFIGIQSTAKPASTINLAVSDVRSEIEKLFVKNEIHLEKDALERVITQIMNS
jgi:hypothetical protein